MTYVYIIMQGRHGNHMFQYWVARYIADRLGWPLKVSANEQVFIRPLPILVQETHGHQWACSDTGSHEFDIEGVIETHRISQQPVAVFNKFMENSKIIRRYEEYVRRLYGHSGREKVDRIVVHMRIGDLESWYMKYHTDYKKFALEVSKMYAHLPVLIVSQDPHHYLTHDLRNALCETGVQCTIKTQNTQLLDDFNDIACSSVIVATNSTFSWWASFLNPYSPTVFIGLSNKQFGSEHRNPYLFPLDDPIPGWNLYDLDKKQWCN